MVLLILADASTDLVKTYGPFAPFAAFLITACGMLWKENRAQATQIVEIMKQVLPALSEATSAFAEDRKTMQQLSERMVTREDLRAELNRAEMDRERTEMERERRQ